MATQTIKIAQNNTAPAIGLTATRGGAPIDVTGATVSAIIAKGNTVVNTGHQTCTITTPTSGLVSYTPQTGDFATPGSYKVDLKVVYAGGGIETLYDQLKIKVRKTLQ